MAGSLNHIINIDGTFSMDLIENIGDAHEALEECYAIIVELSGSDMARVSAACIKHKFPDPYKIQRYGDDPMPEAMKI